MSRNNIEDLLNKVSFLETAVVASSKRDIRKYARYLTAKYNFLHQQWVRSMEPEPAREVLNKSLMSLYKPFLLCFPQGIGVFPNLLIARYGVAETRLMTVEQMKDLVDHMNETIDKRLVRE